MMIVIVLGSLVDCAEENILVIGDGETSCRCCEPVRTRVVVIR